MERIQKLFTAAGKNTSQLRQYLSDCQKEFFAKESNLYEIGRFLDKLYDLNLPNEHACKQLGREVVAGEWR